MFIIINIEIIMGNKNVSYLTAIHKEGTHCSRLMTESHVKLKLILICGDLSYQQVIGRHSKYKLTDQK